MAAGPSAAGGVAPFLRWMRDTALPRWAGDGFDRDAGRFRERLTLDARPIDVPHRAMVQARQIYVFAHAAALGWHDGGSLAERALDRLVADFAEDRDGETSFAFSIDGSGAVRSTVRDAYTHAFVLFALAAAHRLTGRADLLALADRVVRHMDRVLVDPAHGGLFDADPPTDRFKRQNPLMHLLEAHLFLARAAPGRGHEERASRIAGLFADHLFRPGPAVLLEHFAQDWGPHPDPASRDLWEPGHHFEWVWLLAEHDRLTGEDHRDAREALHATALRHGLAGGGLILDAVAADGTPVQRSHRLWPHTEAIKAAYAMAPSGDHGVPALADRMARALHDRFLDRGFAGGWMDRIGPDGEALVDHAPASSLYHLMLAATVAAERAPAR